jgi:hypothetical protein
MKLVRKLVYSTTESILEHEYSLLKGNPIATKYNNFLVHMDIYWNRREEWAVCFRNRTCMRGIHTNNYAESGIRILKDIVFKRVKAYNLVQLFEFLTVTFELYYERRLLAIAYNRVDRYISLKYKGLGAINVDQGDIKKCVDNSHTYTVRSSTQDLEYYVDTQAWMCTCTVGRTGYPSGEPCKHQHAVAKKYNLNAPNLLPYFNGDGRHLHAVIAVGMEKAGDRTFYLRLTDEKQPHDIVNVTDSNFSTHENPNDSPNDSMESDLDSGEENLDALLQILHTNNEIDEVMDLCDTFVKDVHTRIREFDTQYVSGLKKLFVSYLETIHHTEPLVSATPQLASLLHIKQRSSTHDIPGTRFMRVQPTAISRRRSGVNKGSRMAHSGRPRKRPAHNLTKDPYIQTKRGKQDNIKRKQNLRQNEVKNQANHFKHGRGH